MKVKVIGKTVGVEGQDRLFNCQSEGQAGFLASIIREAMDAAYIEGRNDRPQRHRGRLVKKGSAWVGVHYSAHNRRWCINLIPCVTFWITKPGGNVP